MATARSPNESEKRIALGAVIGDAGGDAVVVSTGAGGIATGSTRSLFGGGNSFSCGGIVR